MAHHAMGCISRTGPHWVVGPPDTMTHGAAAQAPTQHPFSQAPVAPPTGRSRDREWTLSTRRAEGPAHPAELETNRKSPPTRGADTQLDVEPVSSWMWLWAVSVFLL